jgi:hypothetical protein
MGLMILGSSRAEIMSREKTKSEEYDEKTKLIAPFPSGSSASVKNNMLQIEVRM